MKNLVPYYNGGIPIEEESNVYCVVMTCENCLEQGSMFFTKGYPTADYSCPTCYCKSLKKADIKQ